MAKGPVMIYRSVHDKEYFCYKREVPQNKNLSLKAKGLHAYLMSLPDNWEIHLSEISSHFTDGKDAIRAACSELEAAGYVVKTKEQKKHGRFTGYVYDVIESGKSDIQKPPLRENRHGKTVTENPPLDIRHGQSRHGDKEAEPNGPALPPSPKSDLNPKSSSGEREGAVTWFGFHRVFLTQDEFSELVGRFGDQDHGDRVAKAYRAIERLDAYLEDAPKRKYKNHWRVICNWVIDTVKKQVFDSAEWRRIKGEIQRFRK